MGLEGSTYYMLAHVLVDVKLGLEPEVTSSDQIIPLLLSQIFLHPKFGFVN